MTLKNIPATHFAFIQNVIDIIHGQCHDGKRLSLDGTYALSLRPLLIVSTIFATYSPTWL